MERTNFLRGAAERTAYAIIFVALTLLAACGGGGSSTAMPAAIEPALVGTVTSELGTSSAASLPGANPPAQIYAEARGSYGYPRYSNTVDPDGTRQYNVSLTQLDGPYLSAHTVSQNYLVSASVAAGRANITPLTTLLVAQLLGADPATAYKSYTSSSADTIARITDANIAAAQLKVTAYLKDVLGITVLSGDASFTKSYFAPKAGDPMYDTILALDAKLAADGTTLKAVTDVIAAEARICLIESASVTVAGKAFDFCPKSKTSTLDESDATVNVYVYTDSKGDVLTVRARAAAVLSTTYVAVSGDTYTCSGAGCTGLSIGELDADQGRQLTFAVTPLTGAAGAVTINGSLHGNKPGASFPTLSCSTNNYFIAFPDRVDAACVALDTLIGLGLGDGNPINASQTRVVHTFRSDGSVQPVAAQLEVRVDGQTVESIFVQDTDPNTGLARYYKCRGTDCNGVTVGPARDDADSFAPFIVRTRKITIADAVVPAINADGSPSTAEPITVRAAIDSFQLVYVDYYSPEESCASNPVLLNVTTTDGDPPEAICPPPDQTFFLGTGQDYLTGLAPEISVYNSAAGNQGAGLVIRMDGNTILSVTYSNYPYGNQYSCAASACAGITVSAPNGAGERTVTLYGTVLQEVETAGLLNPGQTATVTGSFIAPPLP